jgi:hypothetical protein
MKTLPTMTIHRTIYGHGEPRRVAVSLPYVSIIASEPHYTAPPPPPPSLPGERRAPAMTARIRRARGRDPEPPSRDFERVLQRIERGGV